MRQRIGVLVATVVACLGATALPAAASPNTRADGATRVYATTGSLSAQNPAFSPSGSTLFFTQYDCGYDCFSATGGILKMTPTPGARASKLWEKDAATNVNGLASWGGLTNRIAFAIANGNIATVASSGSVSTYKQVTNADTNAGVSYLEPTYRNDGKALTLEEDVPSAIYSDPMDQTVGNVDLMGVNGGPVTRLVSSADQSDNRLPVWSPNGKLILFQRDAKNDIAGGHLQGNYHLYTVDPAIGPSSMTPVTGVAGTATVGDNCDSDASWSPDGRWILDSACYGNIAESNIFLVSPDGKQLIRVTDQPNEEDGAPAMSPDGAWIYFESHRGFQNDQSPSEIWRIPSPVRSDGSTLVYRPPGSTGASAQNPCYAPDKRQLLFTIFSNNYNNDNPPPPNGSAGLYRTAATGGPAQTVVLHSGNAAVNLPGTCYNAVSRRVAYSSDSNHTDNIWTSLPGAKNASEHQVTCYTASNLHAQEPSWSADGTHLVYELFNDNAPNSTSIWTVPATDGCTPLNFHPTRIVPATSACNGSVHTPSDNHQPNWSPDNHRIVFQSSATEGSSTVNLWTVRPDGCGLTQVTRDANSDTDASWSPDGSRIVYSTDFGAPTGVANLFVVKAVAGGARTRLTSQCFYDGAPSWSPDGNWVSYETWPVPNPSANEIPTVIFRIPASAHPAAPHC